MTNAPETLEELAGRARALTGRTIPVERGLRAKGRVGQWVERELGASAGSGAVPDFPELGVELKTLPISPNGKPIESTFVCTLRSDLAGTEEWSTSRVYHKLAHVLWVPVVISDNAAQVGRPKFWSPNEEEVAILRADYEMIMVRLARGEKVTAHAGRWLQLRPKGRSNQDQALGIGEAGETERVQRSGFYLRPVATRQILGLD